MRRAACVTRLLRLSPGAASCAPRAFAARAAALSSAAPAPPPPPPSDAGLLRGAAAAAAAAAFAGAASVVCAEAPAPPPAASGGGGLLSLEYRLRAFYDYERRLRSRATPDKVFEYFASVPATPGAGRFMVPLDLLRAVVPVFPPYGSASLRSGSLPGEPASGGEAGVSLPALSTSALAHPAFFKQFSIEGDGRISFAEFIFFTTLLAIPPGEISAAFRMFDTDSSGSLDREEFRAMMRVLRSQSRHGAAAGGKPARTGFADMPDAERLDDACCSAFFFGKDGRRKLTLPKFEAFMKDLHAAMVSLEFAQYDAAGRGAISPADFGLSLAAVANVSDVASLLQRVRVLEGGAGNTSLPPLGPGAKAPPSYITLPQFASFHALIPRLGELRRALMAYDASGGSVSPAALVGAAKRVCGIDLAPSVVSAIFAVFDTDRDGSLSPAEFLDIMARRRKLEGAGAARGANGEQGSLFDCCSECWAKWRDGSDAHHH